MDDDDYLSDEPGIASPPPGSRIFSVIWGFGRVVRWLPEGALAIRFDRTGRTEVIYPGPGLIQPISEAFGPGRPSRFILAFYPCPGCGKADIEADLTVLGTPKALWEDTSLICRTSEVKIDYDDRTGKIIYRHSCNGCLTPDQVRRVLLA